MTKESKNRAGERERISWNEPVRNISAVNFIVTSSSKG